VAERIVDAKSDDERFVAELAKALNVSLPEWPPRQQVQDPLDGQVATLRALVDRALPYTPEKFRPGLRHLAGWARRLSAIYAELAILCFEQLVIERRWPPAVKPTKATTTQPFWK
jgi:hypothetical protein